MMGLGMPELIIVMVIALLIFGAGKLPEVGSSVGKALRSFKGALAEKPEESASVEEEKKKEEESKG